MAEQHKVEGFAAFEAKLSELRGGSHSRPVVVLFSGGKDPATGRSWCPDCVVAEPVVNAVAGSQVAEGAAFVYCSVGDRSTWKDPNCVFRKDKRTLLTGVPTLLRMDRPASRLVEAQCAKKDLVEMLFED